MDMVSTRSCALVLISCSLIASGVCATFGSSWSDRLSSHRGFFQVTVAPPAPAASPTTSAISPPRHAPARTASAAPAAAAVVAPRAPQRDKLGRSYATGKRKDAVARVWIKPGSGKVVVNGKEMAVYFARPVLQMILRQPMVAASRDTQFG